MSHFDQYRVIRETIDMCQAKRPESVKHLTKSEQASYVIYLNDSSLYNCLYMDLQSDRLELQNILCRGGQIEDILNFSTNNFPLESISLPNSPHISVMWLKAEGEKCSRCWKFDVNTNDDELCPRCDSVVPLNHHART